MKEILNFVKKYNLDAHVIEKDYVIGWVLAAINNNHNLNQDWVFKGGTCLKKCYFDEYRFSEDLDFTLKNPDHLKLDFLNEQFKEISHWIYQETSIEISIEKLVFEQYQNPRGNLSCQGRIYYAAPLSQVSNRSLPKLKLDLTNDEILVNPPVLNKIKHPYSDYTENYFNIYSYSYVEIFAEKTRALIERTRPRDVYDVVNLFHDARSKNIKNELYNTLKAKCEFKNIPFPIKLDDIIIHHEPCQKAWHIQLSHQINPAPDFNKYWKHLSEFFKWLNG